MSPDSVSKARYGSTKVRSGCTTCKVRRVKCDEGKPKCQRCVKARRVCGGYGTASKADPSVRILEYVHYVQPPTRAPDSLPDCDWQEKRSLTFFDQRVAKELSGSFCIELWQRLTLQAAVHESAVRYAVVALSSLYEQRFARPSSRDTPDKTFALHFYGKAIQEVINLDVSSSNQAVDTALLTSVLFAAFECVQGNGTLPITHITGGAQLLAEADNATTLQGANYVPRVLFRQFFVRLESQARELGQGQSHDSPFLNKFRGEMPTAFLSVGHAALCTSALFNRLLRFLQNADDSGMPSDSLPNSPEKVIRKRREYVARYRTFCHSLQDLGATTQEELALLSILKLHREVMSIMLQINLQNGDMEFDRFTSEFQNISVYASEFLSYGSVVISGHLDPLTISPSRLIESTTLKCTPLDDKLMSSYIFMNIHPSSTPVCLLDDSDWSSSIREKSWIRHERPIFPKPGTCYRPSASMGLGIVLPLHITAIRCRDPTIRRQALHLLSICNRMEGIWQSDISARVGERVIQVEEAEMHRTPPPQTPETLSSSLREVVKVTSDMGKKSSSSSSNLIPEHARIIKLRVQFPQPRKLVLDYLRSGACDFCMQQQPARRTIEVLEW